MEHLDYTPVRVIATTWQADAETLARIRQEVFVLEQGISPADEWDDKDEQAVHWLAFSGNGEPIGTARLLAGGQIGRMAVLADHRGRGAGAALLRAILIHARDHGVTQLTLNAQLKAIPLYQHHGFYVCGEVFDDAGLPHRPMRLVTSSSGASPSASSAVASERNALPRHCASFAEQHDVALKLIRSARREILLFSSRLLPEIFDHEDLASAVAHCCLDSHHMEVLMMVRDLDYLSRCHHRLVAQQQRMPSRISLKLLDPAIHTGCGEFLAVDGRGFLELYGETGKAITHAPARTAELRRDFLDLWRVAQPDPNLRRLHI